MRRPITSSRPAASPACLLGIQVVAVRGLRGRIGSCTTSASWLFSGNTMIYVCPGPALRLFLS